LPELTSLRDWKRNFGKFLDCEEKEGFWGMSGDYLKLKASGEASGEGIEEF
jgi:hypothetical protein